MIKQLIVGWIISIVMSAIEKAEGKLDWAAIQAKVDASVKGHLPSFLQDEGAALADSVLAECKTVLESGDNLKSILSLLAAKDYSGAASALKNLLLASWGGLVEHRNTIVTFRT